MKKWLITICLVCLVLSTGLGYTVGYIHGRTLSVNKRNDHMRNAQQLFAETLNVKNCNESVK